MGCLGLQSTRQRCRQRCTQARSRSARECSFPQTRPRAPQRACVQLAAGGDFADFVVDTQESILRAVEELDGSGEVFARDSWKREGGAGGFGVTCVLEDGALVEKGGVNVSVLRGVLTPARAQSMSSRGRGVVDPSGGQPYSAAALSLVLHPRHPLVPTLRADVRVFQVERQCWYGGGADLTPSYLFEQDAAEFHACWKRVCDAHAPHLYRDYKEWCDRYFYLPARHEHRGVGGIFFDDLDPATAGFDADAFVREVAATVVPSWAPIVARRRDASYTDAQRQWQLLRRGRYLEFNLLYDRGVKFGLDGGRVESIMVSAPPLVAWRYNAVPADGSDEAALLAVLRKPRAWA